MAEHTITQATTASNEDAGRKVFVGNLDFKTTDDTLREIFAGQGTIVEAQIIKKFSRSTRSLGYGFVTFSTEAEATSAISTFDKKEYGGRTINVELAKPPSNTPRGGIAKEAAEAAGGEAATEGHETSGRGRRGKPRRGRGAKRGRGVVPADGETEGGAAAEANGGAEPVAPTSNGAAEAEGAGGRGRGRGVRRGRGGGRGAAPKGPPTGEPSKTLLFVANLPFSLDNDGLKAVFEGYSVVNAHVVVRKYGPVTGRSKGFGFVELSDEAEQKKVLEAFNGKEVDGREIQVKVAVEPPPAPEEEAKPEADSAT